MPSYYLVNYNERFVVACVREVECEFKTNPRSLAKIVFSQLDTSNPLTKGVREALEASPWIRALRAIEHIQGINENEENDPWKKELTPLMEDAFKNNFISLEKPEDAELVVHFVQEIGMINNPLLFKIFLACNRARKFEDLPEDVVATIEEFDIPLKKPDGKWRFSGPMSVISELRVVVRQMMVDLFEDKEVPALETELGEGLFSVMRGKTQWERNDRITVLAKKWRETIARNPKSGELPKGVHESKFFVKTLNANRAPYKQKEQNIEDAINKVFIHKELMMPYISMSEALRTGITETDPAVWWKTRKTSILLSLRNAIEQLQMVLNATPEELDAMIELEENEDKKQLLAQKRGALGTERGRRAMEKQLHDLKHANELVSAIEYLEEQSDEETIVRAMEVLAYAGTTSYGIGRSLRELSALHLVKTLPDGFRDQLINSFAVNTEPTVERVNLLAEISRQFILEHYLHPEQKIDHTSHSPFSKELLKELKFVWGIKFDNKGRMPIEVLNTRIQNVVHGDDAVSQKGVEVAMMPAKGILRIFAGDFGDACYTGLHNQLAEGQYPGLFAWVYATNYGTPQVAIKGSLIGIVTEREDGAGALIARANNPKENFIRSVDHKQFVMKSLKEVVDSARRIHASRLRAEPNMHVEKRRFSVAIPLDSSSNSCTNRPLVAEVYHKHFKSLPRTGFKNTPETNFNNYNIWYKDGSHACVVIWEIDENGKETWFGDWDNASVS